jgi:hypothetical protein
LSKKLKKMHKHGIKHIEEEVETIEKDVKKIEKDINIFSKFENIIFEIIIILIFGIALGALAGYMVGTTQPLVIESTQQQSPTTELSIPEGLAQDIEIYLNSFPEIAADTNVQIKVVESEDQTQKPYQFEFMILVNGSAVDGGRIFSNEQTFALINAEFDLNKSVNVSETTKTAYNQSENPAVDLFIMSFCPYGLQAVDVFNEPIQLLEEKINFNMGYIIYQNYASGYGLNWEDYCFDKNEQYCSMHGIEELNENVRELCIQKYQKDKFWDYMNLLVADYSVGKVSTNNIAEKWQDYATTAGLDISAIESCVANETENLLEEQVMLNQAYGVQGSPTAIINGAKYDGARTPDGFKTAVCSAFLSAPENCETTLDTTSTATAGSC